MAEDSRDYKMREKMCRLWTNFAKYGNPTPENCNPLEILWEPVTSADIDLKYMILAENSHMATSIHSERVEFWKNIYEKYNGSFLNPKF